MAGQGPQITHGALGASYTENSAPIVVCNSIVLTDNSSPVLTSATVHFTRGYEPGLDVLEFTDQNGIAGSWNAATGTLTLTGAASIADYQAALRSVTYFYGGDDPATNNRSVNFSVSDGVNTSRESPVRFGVLAVNDLPTLAVDPVIPYTTYTLPTTLDANLSLTDPDSGMRGATVTISGNYHRGEDVLSWTNTAHVHGKFDARSGVLTLTGNASAAEYQQVLRSITYTDKLASPSLDPRTVTIQVQDAAGAKAFSNVGTITVLFSAPPDVGTSGTPIAYTEGDPAVTLEPALTLSDIDDPNMASATVSITAGLDAGDSLLFTNTANITGSYDGSTGVLTLTGSAPVAEYRAALQSIQFVGTTDDPSTTKTITWVVNDGDDNSTPVTTTINVTPVNDAPTLSVSATLDYTENDAATAIAPSATLTDPDSPDFSGGSLTVGFSANGTSADQLTIIDQGTGAGQIGVSGSTITYEGVAIATFTGGTNGSDLVITFTSAAATQAAVQALVRDIAFSDTSDDPSALARTVGFTLVDGDGTANGGLDTGTASATVNVTSVNDAPVVTPSVADAAYTEGGSAVALDIGIALSDPDNATLGSATISITGNFQAGDALNFTNTANITGSYNSGTGVLTLSGTASLAEYQAALQSITFTTSNDDPNTSKTVTWTVNDGTDSSASQTSTIDITPVNDAPTLSVSATLGYTENDAATAIAPSATLADPDSTDFNGGSLTASFTANGTAADQLTIIDQGTGAGQIGVSGNDITYGGVTIGTFSGGANGADLVITFTDAAATQAAVQALVRDIAFSNTSDNPSTTARTVGFTLVDGDGTANGGADTGTATATVNVTAVNDAPVVTPSGTAAAYTEGGAAVALDTGIALSDLDNTTLGSATVSISGNFQAGDALTFTDTAHITGSYNSGTGVLTLTGTASLAEYEAALQSVKFQTTNDDPSTSKTITWAVNDGTDSSASQTSTIDVTPVNDAPTLSISATLAYTENDAVTAIASSATLSDPDSIDFNGGSLTVSFTANGTAADQLTIIDQGTGASQIGVSGSSITYGGVTIGTFSGGADGADLVITFTSAAATQAAVQALVRDIGYSNSSDNPSALARTVGFALKDGDGTANGGADTGTATATVNVTPANDAPTIVNSVSPATFTEGGAAVTIDGTIAVSDPDNTSLASATVAITAGFETGDALHFTNTANITGSYNSGTGVLTLTGAASLAEYQSALQSITFQGTSDAPITSKTVSWTVNDGADDSATATTTVNVTPVNDAPALSITATLGYTENGAAAAIASAATVGDPDSTDFNGGSLTAGFTSNGTTADQLTIINQGTGAGQIGVSGSSVTYEGTTIGTFTGGTNGTDLVVTFTSSAATQAAAQALVRDIAYSNSSDNPSTLARTVGYTLVDGDGTALGGTDTATASATVNVTATNDAPTVTPSGTAAAYTEGGAAAVLDASIAIADPDGTTIAGATVSITAGRDAGDALVFASQNGISGSYNSGTGVLTLSGTASIADYQTALRSITFQGTSDAPTTSKTVSWVVSDGTDSSVAHTSTINVTPVNDAPTVTPSGAAAAYTEGGAAALLDATLAIADPDDTNLESATISITAGMQTGDSLVFTNQNGITGTYNASTGVLTLNGTATVAQYQTALESVTFETSNDNPTTSKTVTWVVNDGTDNSIAKTSTVNITPVNDPPTVTTSGGNAAWTEAGPAAVIDSSIDLADPDSTTFASATVQITSGYLSGHDVLAFTNTAGMGNIAASFNAATGTLTLTSSSGTATVAQWQTALASVTFDSDSNSPGASRTISFQVSDGTDTSNVGTKSIAITEVNSAPDVTTSGGSAAFVENSPAVAIDSSIQITDADSTDLHGATVHIGTGFQSSQDVLHFTNTANISGSYDAATGTLTLTGTDSVANYEAALASVTYDNTSDTPDTATRTIEFQVDDGENVDNLSSVATRTVTVAATNDAPAVTVGATLAYTENDAATPIAPLATVSDVDSTDFNGGSLTVSFTANGTTADQLTIIDQGTGAGQIGVSGSNVTYEGTTIGTFTGGTNGTDLVVTFNSAAATAAATQALARDIAYSNSSESPSTAARTVNFKVVDGDGGTNTGSGNATVNVTSVNDAPVLSGSNTTPINYTENDPATVIDSGITITDVDSANLASAKVTISSNFQSGEDVLAFTNTASITGSYNAATGVLTLSGIDTVAHYQAALDSVTYRNTSENPSAATRTVTFEVNDGAASHNLSNDVTHDITVTPVNDPPVVTAGGTLAYTENAAATVINSGITVSDAEGDNITGATVSISGNFQSSQDVLSFTPTGNITGSYNSSTGVLTLSGTDTAAHYQAAFDSVTYFNSSDNPSTAARTISFAATDSHGDTGSAATSTVNVTAVNDAPVNTVPSDASVGTAFSNTAMAISGVSVADVDSGSGLMTVQLSASTGSGTALSVSLAGGATVSAGSNGSNSVTLQGTASQLNAALGTLSYQSKDGFTGSDTITVTTNDGGNTGTGGAHTDTDTFHVGVVPQVFIIDNTDTTADTATAGTAANPFNSIASFNSLANDGAGDYVYIMHGTGTYSEASGLTLNNNEQVIGQGQSLQFTNPVTGATVTVGTGTSGNTPTLSITGASQAGVTLAQGNTLTGFNIATTLGSQTGIVDGGGTVGTLTVNNMNVTGTGMGVDIDQGGALTVTLGTLSSTGSSQQGVQLAGTGATALTGSFSATTGTISGSTSTGFLIGDGAGNANTGGTATISYGGSVSTTGTAKAVDIEDRSSGAGTVTFSGNVGHSSGNAVGILIDDVAGGAITFSGSNTLNTGTSNAIQASDVTSGSLTFSGNQDIDTTSGTGISLATNSVATSFTGLVITINTTSNGQGVNLASNSGAVTVNTGSGSGLDIVTSGGTGINASSSGTLTIQGSGNSISSTNATAVNVANTTIGASGLNFQSVSSSGATNGIVLNTTGTGSLTVTGTGTANSGGTISGATGDAVNVTSGVFNLGYMQFSNPNQSAIDVSNLIGSSSVDHSTITGFGATSGNNITGNGINVVNTGNNAGTLTVSNSTFSNGANGNDAIFMEAQGSGTMTLVVNNDTMTGIYGDGVQVNGITGATSAEHVTIQNSTFQNAVASTGNGGISLNPFGNVTFYADVNNNTFNGIMNPVTNLGAIGVTNGANADAEITIRNNKISNIAGGRGITLFADGGTNKYLIDNNWIDNLSAPGPSGKAAISVTFNNNTTLSTVGTGSVTVSNNQIGQHGTTTGVLWTGSGIGASGMNNDAISLQAINGATMTSAVTGNIVSANTSFEDVIVYATLGGTMNASISGNTLTDTAASHNEITAQAGSGSTVNVSIGTNTLPAGSSALIFLAATGTMHVTQASSSAISTANSSAQMTVSGSPVYGSSAPPSPTLPTLPMLGGAGAANDDGAHTITVEDIASAMAAAADRWAQLPLTQQQILQLASLKFTVGHLDGGAIGAEMPGLIVLDVDAGGRGWFVDPTPLDDSEFASNGSATHLYGLGGDAAAHVDLLTVVMHEMGHALGLSDLYGTQDANDIMYGALNAGERVLPSAQDLPVTVVGVTDTGYSGG